MAHGRHRAAAAARNIMLEQAALAEKARLARMEETKPMREYEMARMGRGRMALEGRYKVAEDPQFQMTREALRKTQGQQFADIEEAGAKGGLGGFSASYLSEKMKETGANTILNLAASMQGRQQELVEEGSVAGQRMAGLLEPEFERGFAEEQRMGEMQYAAHEAAYQRAHEKKMGTMQTIGGICCYIFYCGQVPMFYIRAYKDEHYAPDSDVAVGYKKLASWLTPQMKKYQWVMKLTRILMLYPMVWYAEAFYNKKYFQKIALRPISLFWVWTYIVIGKLFRYSVTWTDYLELSKESMGV